MLVAEFFKWWYGEGWKYAGKSLFARVQSIGQVFSVKLLARTLFSPWRRIIAERRRGFDGAVHAAIDNAVGRLIGFSVRCIVLITAGLTMIVMGVVGLILLVLWPLLPPAALTLLIVGVLR